MKQCNWWCAACGGQCDWKNPNRVLVIQDNTEAKVFQAHTPPQEMCEHLVIALKLLTNQQKDGDGPVQNGGRMPTRKQSAQDG